MRAKQSDKSEKKHGLEIQSQSLGEELVAIKDRLGAIETIQSISNAPYVKKYAECHIKSDDARKIMAACESPRTRSELQVLIGKKSVQAADHHIKPLREADLLREVIDKDRTILLEWSKLFRGLPKADIQSILLPKRK